MIRLDKFLADMSVGTRNEVKKVIKSGNIFVNGQLVLKPDIKIDENKDLVTVNGEDIAYCRYEYFMLNKPMGYVSATSDSKNSTVVSLIDENTKKDIFPVGRLDIDTEGLLLITNDGRLAHNLLSPKKHVDKKYFVIVNGEPDKSHLALFEHGVDIGDETPTLPAKVNIIKSCTWNELENYQDKIKEACDYRQENAFGTSGNCSKAGVWNESNYCDQDDTYNESYYNGKYCMLELKIHEGRYHQVKRMFLAIGFKVMYLKRIQMGRLKLDEKLKCGDYRKLTNEEIYFLTNGD